MRNIFAARRGEQGFTLIELLIVVIIIGVLAAIALPLFLQNTAEAKNAGVKSDVRNTVPDVTAWLADSNNTATSDYTGDTTDTNGNDISVTPQGDDFTEGYLITGQNADTGFCWQYDSLVGKSNACDYSGGSGGSGGGGGDDEETPHVFDVALNLNQLNWKQSSAPDISTGDTLYGNYVAGISGTGSITTDTTGALTKIRVSSSKYDFISGTTGNCAYSSNWTSDGNNVDGGSVNVGQTQMSNVVVNGGGVSGHTTGWYNNLVFRCHVDTNDSTKIDYEWYFTMVENSYNPPSEDVSTDLDSVSFDANGSHYLANNFVNDDSYIYGAH